jgi:(p)ppGpp synthase/HD superfamily hydrolase
MRIIYATCCYPIPGDDIRGVLEAGQGIKVHRCECPQLLESEKTNPNAYIHVKFAELQTKTFPVKLSIWIKNTKGAVANIANTIAAQDVNITEFQINELDNNIQGVISAVIEVKDRKHLAQVIRKGRRLSCVTRMERPKFSLTRKPRPAL